MPGQHQPINLSRQTLLQLAEFRAMAEEQLVRLGAAIQRRRQELDWSRARLARELPVDPKTVERWEKAQTGGAMDVLSQIADALGTTADDLLADSLERPERGPTPDLFATESGATADELHELRAELRQTRAELLAEIETVRRGQASLLRHQGLDEPQAEETGR